MAITVHWPTKVITIPQADLTLVSGALYELDVNALRLLLKDLEDAEEGIGWPTTHNHNTEVVLSGVTYARTFEVINGYTITFQNTGTPYVVRCIGANHNLGDVTNFDGGCSLIVGNAAGLVSAGSGLSAPQAAQLRELHEKAALDPLKPVSVSPSLISFGDVDIDLAEVGSVVTGTRQP